VRKIIELFVANTILLMYNKIIQTRKGNKMTLNQAIVIIEELQQLLGLSFIETLKSMERNHDSLTEKQGIAFMCFMANPL